MYRMLRVVLKAPGYTTIYHKFTTYREADSPSICEVATETLKGC